MSDEFLTVAALQLESQVGETEANVQRSIAWLDQAANGGARLAVLPELCNIGYPPASRAEALQLAEGLSGPTLEAWCAWSRRRDAYLVAGFCERHGERCYNSAAVIGPEGVWGVYRKAHLFHREKEIFDPGDKGFPVFELPFGRLGVLICYDLRFPEAVRCLALGGADVIAVPAAWVTLKGRRHDERGFSMQAYCAMAHASMNQLFMICASSVGPFGETAFLGGSLIVGCDGWPLAGPASTTDEALIAASICPAEAQRAKQRNPYNHTFGDRRLDLYRGP